MLCELRDVVQEMHLFRQNNLSSSTPVFIFNIVERAEYTYFQLFRVFFGIIFLFIFSF